MSNVHHLPQREPSTRALPVNIEAEQAVLGCILMWPDSYLAASQVIKVEHFSEPLHQRIYEIAGALVAEGKTPSPITIKTYLADQKVAEGMNAQQYLAHIAASAIPAAQIAGVAGLVVDLAARRQIISIANEAAEIAYDAPVGMRADQVAAGAVSALDEIAIMGVSESMRRSSIGQAARKAIESTARRKAGEPVRGVSTGLDSLDTMLGALERKQGSVLAGRPSMGKTAVAVSMALAAANAGAGVLYISLEMGDVPLAQRAMAAVCFDDPGRPVEYSRIARGMVSDHEIGRLDLASRRLDHLPILIEQQPSLSVSQITARARQARSYMASKNRELELVIVDHLGLVGASNRYKGDRVREMGEISSGLHGLAKELDVHVLMLSQLSRSIESREDKRPQLHDLRESGELEQNADVVMGVYREAYYLERKGNRTIEEDGRLIACENELEIGVLKNRQGPTGPVRLFCNIGCNAVRDLHK